MNPTQNNVNICIQHFPKTRYTANTPVRQTPTIKAISYK